MSTSLNLTLCAFMTLSAFLGCRKEEQLPDPPKNNVYTVWLFEKEVKIPLVNAPLLIYRSFTDTIYSDSALKIIRQLPPDTVLNSNSSARISIAEKDTGALLLLTDNESYYSDSKIQVTINDTGFYYKTGHVKMNFVDDASITNLAGYTLAFVNFYTLGDPTNWPFSNTNYGNFYVDSIPGADKSVIVKLPAGKNMISEYWWSYNNGVPSVKNSGGVTTVWIDTVSMNYYY